MAAKSIVTAALAEGTDCQPELNKSTVKSDESKENVKSVGNNLNESNTNARSNESWTKQRYYRNRRYHNAHYNYGYFYYFLMENGPMNSFNRAFGNCEILLSHVSLARIRLFGGLQSYLRCDPRFRISRNTIGLSRTERPVQTTSETKQQPEMSTSSKKQLRVNDTAKECIPLSKPSPNVDNVTDSDTDVVIDQEDNATFTVVVLTEDEESPKICPDKTLLLSEETEPPKICPDKTLLPSEETEPPKICPDKTLLPSEETEPPKICENKWTAAIESLTKEHADLNAVNQTMMTELNSQLEYERIKAYKAQLQIVDLGRLVSLSKIDFRVSEADFQIKLFHSSFGLNKESQSLPTAARANYNDLRSYIILCQILKCQVEGTAQRLKDKLKLGLSIDISEFEVSLPSVPVLQNEVDYSSLGTSSSDSHAVSNSVTDSHTVSNSVSDSCVVSNSEIPVTPKSKIPVRLNSVSDFHVVCNSEIPVTPNSKIPVRSNSRTPVRSSKQ